MNKNIKVLVSSKFQEEIKENQCFTMDMVMDELRRYGVNDVLKLVKVGYYSSSGMLKIEYKPKGGVM